MIFQLITPKSGLTHGIFKSLVMEVIPELNFDIQYEIGLVDNNNFIKYGLEKIHINGDNAINLLNDMDLSDDVINTIEAYLISEVGIIEI